MKRSLLIIVVFGLLIAVKLLFFSNKEEQSPAMKPGMGGPVFVTAMVVEPEALERKVFVTGSILPNEEVALVPETSGKITHLNFKEVSIVNKGDLLVKINDADLQAQLKKLKAQEALASEKEKRQKLKIIVKVRGVIRFPFMLLRYYFSYKKLILDR